MEPLCQFCGKPEPRWILIEHQYLPEPGTGIGLRVDPNRYEGPYVCVDCLALIAPADPGDSSAKTGALASAADALRRAASCGPNDEGDHWRRIAETWIAIAHETGYE